MTYRLKVSDDFIPYDQETIIACCTPQGSGALALIRLSGNNSLVIASSLALLSSNKKIHHQETHTIHHGWVVDTNNNRIDEVLFFIMKSPKTFTGQDTVEISCHNNPFIIEAIIQQAIYHGARLAQQGEFTKRALLSGKMDLLQAEAINELIHANTQQALKQSLRQLQGSFSHWVYQIEQDLIKALAFSEASFEFIDEENMTFAPQIHSLITQVQENIATIKKTFDQQQHIRNGIRIALIGCVNAGKSSLFNALLGTDRAIVTHIAGTTRDVIEAGIYRNGAYWTLIDTAGLRKTDNIVEEMGIQKSLEQAHLADIIILVVDPIVAEHDYAIIQSYAQIMEHYNNKIICVQTKQDIHADITWFTSHLVSQSTHKTLIHVASTTRQGIDTLEANIQKQIDYLLSKSESPFLLNQRHFNMLLGLEHILHELTQILAQSNVPYELLSYHLNDALTHISELTGKSISEKGMDAIFRQFCVGK